MSIFTYYSTFPEEFIQLRSYLRMLSTSTVMTWIGGSTWIIVIVAANLVMTLLFVGYVITPTKTINLKGRQRGIHQIDSAESFSLHPVFKDVIRMNSHQGVEM